MLSGLFFALVLLSYERFVRKPSSRRLAVVAVALALGLTAKSMLVTVPGDPLLLDIWPLGRVPRGAAAAHIRTAAWTCLLVEKLPLVMLCAGSAALTMRAQRDIGAITPMEVYTPWMRLGNGLVSLASYLGMTFWPEGLSVYYPHPLSRLPPGQVAASVLALAVVTVVARSSHLRLPLLSIGWLWHLGMLVPVVEFVKVGGQARADLCTYLPLISIFPILAWSFPAARGRCGLWLRVPGAGATLLSRL